jgi:uncharacterized membrane protein
MNSSIISSPAGVMTVLISVVAFWFWLERSTRWKIFEFLPPLIFIYASPVLLSNFGVIPFHNAAYDFLYTYGLPIFIVMMLIKVDVLGAIRIMGKGVFVMLLGSVGVVVGGVVSYKLGQSLNIGNYLPLPEDSWRAFGTLAGSWIGGTGNMTAAHAGLEGTADHMTMAAAADQMVYLVWLPILLGSKAFADRFNRMMKVPADRIELMEQAASKFENIEDAPSMIGFLYLGLLAVGFTAIALSLSKVLPPVMIAGATVITAGTWLILLVTTFAYVYVARVGATMDLSVVDWDKMTGFIAMAYVWITIHAAFILTGAWLFRVDVHTVAIASAANIGGAASAPIVAAHHRETLVPASILMALIGYALGNYLAILTGRLGQLMAG